MVFGFMNKIRCFHNGNDSKLYKFTRLFLKKKRGKHVACSFFLWYTETKMDIYTLRFIYFNYRFAIPKTSIKMIFLSGGNNHVSAHDPGK